MINSIIELRRLKSRQSTKLALEGYLLITPWLLGFLMFQIGPIIASFILTFTRYDIITFPKFIGLENFKFLAKDRDFQISLIRTFYYVGGSVPLSIIASLLIALLLNKKILGISWFRTMYYTPSVTSGVAIAIVWGWVFQPNYGLLNSILQRIGIIGPGWLNDPKWAMPAVILVSIWSSIGRQMILFLAALQGVPSTLYDAAKIDGANGWNMFRFITFPMISPTVFFSLIVGIIGAFQGAFTYVYIMSGITGGPLKATYVYMLHLYNMAFRYFNMGYAATLAWILFAITATLTALQFKLSSWVYYEGGVVRR
jgi:multiple sugar transport system permease protein